MSTLGKIIIKSEWQAIDGIQIEDVVGNLSKLTINPSNTYTFQNEGNCAVCCWEGDYDPQYEVVAGIILESKQRAVYQPSKHPLFMRSLNNNVVINVKDNI